ncbi:hypothetical protein DB35_23210 [Streptomyces abyssalis]|uniref:Uncharacterized protein n=1 Tax=Streptomyces abyssalis TaxID=933944 RepID=A0A1E7JP28_9ACTN|nr:hypothetical protein DB35_23210 [Streptomyces abyssalis]OEU90004.1 hypothetical protein AN215_10310 [Streptomyces abyssalis]
MNNVSQPPPPGHGLPPSYGPPQPSGPQPSGPPPSPYGYGYGQAPVPPPQAGHTGTAGHAGPHGAPQQPYPAQQPHPPQQPYGPYPYGPQPPGPGWGPPPPKKSNAGKVVAIVLGSLVVLGGLAQIVKYSASGNRGPDASAAKYEVSMPRTLLDGKYKLTQDMSDEAGTRNTDLAAGDEQYVGMYSGGSGKEQLLYSGLNSEATGGEGSDDKLLDGMSQASGTDVAVPRREIVPAGGDEPLTCEVITKSRGGEELTIATCAWSDPGSVASVADNSPETLSSDPDEVDLEALAGQVDTIRDEVRSPAG